MQKPFDPLELAKETEKLVIRGNQRKYNIFRVERYYGQTATARGVGCNSRCFFCWINPSRDNPANYGAFYSPEQVYDNLVKVSSNEFGRLAMSNMARISGCEPTIGKEHLLSLIYLLKSKHDKSYGQAEFETNGFVLGTDPSYIKALNQFGGYVHIRVSLKAGTPEDLERKTGVKGDFYELPFLALKQLASRKMSYTIAAMSSDPVLMPPDERRSLLRAVANALGFIPRMDEEEAFPFGITIKRLKAAGVIHDAAELGGQRYEDVFSSLNRVAQKSGVKISNKRGIIITKPTEGIQQLIHDAEFKTEEVDRARCSRCGNVWHGRNIEDDLDPKLN